MLLSINQIVDRVIASYPDVQLNSNWGEKALFYNPSSLLPKGIYLMTFKERDSSNDRSSSIQAGEFRLNLAMPKPKFIELFGSIPSRPPAGGVITGEWDFKRSDVLTPHPVYGWMCWAAVKNPSIKTLSRLDPILAESYQIAVRQFARRISRRVSMARSH